MLGQLVFTVVFLRSTKKGLWVEGAKKSNIVRKQTGGFLCSAAALSSEHHRDSTSMSTSAMDTLRAGVVHLGEEKAPGRP